MIKLTPIFAPARSPPQQHADDRRDVPRANARSRFSLEASAGRGGRSYGAQYRTSAWRVASNVGRAQQSQAVWMNIHAEDRRHIVHDRAPERVACRVGT